ncbi:hypothetical protein SOVF_055510 [Spinacia oleracea]|nr:hypothetical protein SOVF_055510 [Spinacia oleracea]
MKLELVQVICIAKHWVPSNNHLKTQSQPPNLLSL